MIQKRKRDIAVSPRKQTDGKILALVNGGLGDLDFEKDDKTEESGDVDNEWETLSDKYEDLERKVEELLNVEQN